MASTSGGARHESSVNALAARWIASAIAKLAPRIGRDATGSRAPPATPSQIELAELLLRSQAAATPSCISSLAMMRSQNSASSGVSMRTHRGDARCAAVVIGRGRADVDPAGRCVWTSAVSERQPPPGETATARWRASPMPPARMTPSWFQRNSGASSGPSQARQPGPYSMRQTQVTSV